MVKNLLLSMAVILIFSSCSDVLEKPPLVISVDPWIGSAPFYYAHAKGWLEEANIQLILAPSISENLRIFESNASDMFTGTQHEYFRERKTHPDLIPIIHYDRSFGGDIVMANRTTDELQKSDETIDLYLEANTVNEEMADYWIADNHILKDRLRMHTRPQDEIVNMKTSVLDSPMVIVTYNPHNIVLEKKGFRELVSTREDRYLVVDAVYVSSKIYHENQKTFHALHDAIVRSMDAYHKDPKEFYETCKVYFDNPQYDEFISMKKNVQWFSKPASPKLLKRLNSIGFDTKDLIL